MEILILLLVLIIGAGVGRFSNIMLGRPDDNPVENVVLGVVGIVLYGVGVWVLSLLNIGLPDMTFIHLAGATASAFLAVVVAEVIRGQ
jgi:uncharacterized membrane protein YeaQ/YmgE (transglycosylase-associated protein family)